jgi:hypothetical protein
MLKQFSEVIALDICLLAFNHTGALTHDMAVAMIITAFACLVFRLIFNK